ncbi:unnamed protein product [Urochloa decumbens]|uniref:Uncharacterized protein n=1 Tax=Urochloa decumbens TaxID=240449 RepID=A0ABC9BRS1_9POAL
MGGSDEDFSEEMEWRPLKITPPVSVLKNFDKLEEKWGWEMLLPFKGFIEWSDYCNYLEHYYTHNCNLITEVTGSCLVDAAETCLKKEDELVCLWDRKMKQCTDEILPKKTFILSSLIQEFANKVKRAGGKLSDVSTAALLCITKEADLICKMLNAGAEPSAYLINQSTEIRMCALGLTNHQLRDSIPAAAAMVGIMKETIKICHWISENNVPFDAFDVDLDNDFELGRQVRGNIIDGDDIAPAEAANMTGCNTQDQEKITGTNISKKRSLEGADKEADHQEVGICRNGSRLSKRGGRHHYLGHGDDHGVPLRLEYLTGSSDDIRKNQMEICTDEDRMVLDSSIEDLEEGDDAKTVPPPVGIVKFAVY